MAAMAAPFPRSRRMLPEQGEARPRAVPGSRSACVFRARSPRRLRLTSRAAGCPYPTRPVRIIVPVTAGSGSDIIGRLIAQRLS
jgi:hypothetical protein